ncbi:MAG: 50S ribosomal protein L17 [Coriobacteriales bacterium]|jgi:large subunit ribosomal protein L17|nr:50S ribosomal protein L17 [Coriobacteriales bacterium]
MRHYKKGRKLGTSASHTKAIKKNLVVNLFKSDRIKTTLERAKEIRGDVDRVITWAKRGDVHSRRLAIAKLGDKDLVAEIFTKVGQGLFRDRPGGYTRILKLGKRRGDTATIVIMELVQEPVAKKAAKDAPAPAAKAAAKKPKKPAKDEKPADKDEAVAEEELALDGEASEDEAPAVIDVEPLEAESVVEDAADADAAEDAPVADAPAEEPAAEDAPAEDAPAEDEAPAE